MGTVTFLGVLGSLCTCIAGRYFPCEGFGLSGVQNATV